MSVADSSESTKVGLEGALNKLRRHEKDSGSPEVQIALLTDRIEQISGHMKKFVKDFNSERGMLKLISRRKRLLAYLKDESVERYRQTLSVLGLRK